MRKYRNRGQIKTNGGHLAEYTLLLFEETVKAIFNKAVRDNLVTFNPIHGLTVQLAFGLSSMTRLRLGDMQYLRWCDIKDIDGVPTICINQ